MGCFLPLPRTKKPKRSRLIRRKTKNSVKSKKTKQQLRQTIVVHLVWFGGRTHNPTTPNYIAQTASAAKPNLTKPEKFDDSLPHFFYVTLCLFWLVVLSSLESLILGFTGRVESQIVAISPMAPNFTPPVYIYIYGSPPHQDPRLDCRGISGGGGPPMMPNTPTPSKTKGTKTKKQKTNPPNKMTPARIHAKT
jgi:hypothetical protein